MLHTAARCWGGAARAAGTRWARPGDHGVRWGPGGAGPGLPPEACPSAETALRARAAAHAASGAAGPAGGRVSLLAGGLDWARDTPWASPGPGPSGSGWEKESGGRSGGRSQSPDAPPEGPPRPWPGCRPQPPGNRAGRECRGRGRRSPTLPGPLASGHGPPGTYPGPGVCPPRCVHSPPCPPSLRVPSSKGRRHVCYWQLEGGLAPFADRGDAIRKLKSGAPIGQHSRWAGVPGFSLAARRARLKLQPPLWEPGGTKCPGKPAGEQASPVHPWAYHPGAEVLSRGEGTASASMGMLTGLLSVPSPP